MCTRSITKGFHANYYERPRTERKNFDIRFSTRLLAVGSGSKVLGGRTQGGSCTTLKLESVQVYQLCAWTHMVVLLVNR